MNNQNATVWGIHSEDDRLFLNHDIVAIGWNEVGDLGKIENSIDAFKERVRSLCTYAKPRAVPLFARMLYRFMYEMKIDDYIVFPSKIDRMINIGKIKGNYEYMPSDKLYYHTRKVEWLKHIPRTVFSQGALYEVGSALTLFSVKNYADEFLLSLDKNFSLSVTDDSDDESIVTTAEDIMQNTKDFILKELSRQLKGYPLESLVADLLNAMGYRTVVSPQGGDRGIDIIAYKDELPPRIAVQVKSQDAPISETLLQSLKGAMMPGDYGLFIALSAYTENAKKFLEVNPIIRGISGDELAELILRYYEQMSETYQQIIPLKKVYIPVGKDMNTTRRSSTDSDQNDNRTN